MRSTAMIVTILTLWAAMPAHARTKLVALPEREGTTVSFQNPAATLVEEERVLTLQEGENFVDFSWNGVRIDPDSIRLAVLSHPDAVRLLSVSYPPGEAALVWRLHASGAGEERVRISYLLSGVDRLVAYRGVATKDESAMELSAFLILRNFSGEDFYHARFDLGQGTPFTGDSAHEETRRVLYLSAPKVPLRKVLTWDARSQPWDPRRLDIDVGIPMAYVLQNTPEAGLGSGPLWDGKFRVYQDDGHGGAIFLGESAAAVTPVGKELRLTLGESRDVAVTQKKIREVRVNPRPSRVKVVLYDTDEAVEATVENFKNEPVRIDLVERVEGEWEMAEASLPYEAKDAGTFVFHVEVPPKGKTVVTYAYNRRNVRN